jgi:hypothetical protein
MLTFSIRIFFIVKREAAAAIKWPWSLLTANNVHVTFTPPPPAPAAAAAAGNVAADN